MIKAVIFDMDGVLVDSEPKNLEQLKGFMKGYIEHVDDTFLASLVGKSHPATYRDCVAKMQVAWNMETFSKKYEDYVSSHAYNYADILNDGVHDILSWLRQHGIRTAVASSSTQKQISTMEYVCGLKGHFNLKVSGEQFTESKPHPEIYLHTAQKLGVKPEECLAVEDSTYGITAARRAGMRVLAYRDERYGVNQLEAHHIIDSMHDIKQYVKG